MKKINFYDVICLLILRGKTCQSTASLLFMITPPSREYSRNMLMNDHHEKRSGRGCQSTASLLFMITPPFSWIFTKYANEWPPRKKIRKGSTRKKDQHEKRTGSGQHEKRCGSGQHEKETGSGHHEKGTGSDPWPLTFDLNTKKAYINYCH